MAATLYAASSSLITARRPAAPLRQTAVVARFSFGKKKAKAAPPPKKKAAGGVANRPMWLPGAKPPEWLDGSLPGDYGFDPLGLGKPAEYLQYDLDSLDQNLAKNEAGDIIGTLIPEQDIKPTAVQPYGEVFGLQRFRECELIHGRWAMLGTLGALAVEAFTGVYWQDAGKVELVEGSSYFGLPLPFNMQTLVLVEVLLVGYIEIERNKNLDPETRLYPGGKYFDPFGLAADPVKSERLKLAEIKHARLAMVAFLIFGIQALFTGKGPLTLFIEFLGKK
uniref:Chlorophyll a-b binding protein, chloroplastic n=1 Tax=Wollemia nobilis TaxID=56998 RepID=A0A0C9S7B4_9CONI